MLTKSRLIVVTALAAAALGAAPAQGMPIIGGAEGTPSSDLRSPDARDGGSARATDAGVTPPDLRTPDARDGGFQPVTVEVVGPDTSAFDWTALVIGAAGGLGLAVITGAGIALARRPARTRVA